MDNIDIPRSVQRALIGEVPPTRIHESESMGINGVRDIDTLKLINHLL